MAYEKLVHKIGSLHRLLRELAEDNQYQGEHAITYTDAEGAAETLYIHIDGTEFQMYAAPDSGNLRLHVGARN